MPRLLSAFFALLFLAGLGVAQIVEEGTVTDVTQRLERVRTQLNSLTSQTELQELPRERFAEIQGELSALQENVGEQGKRIGSPLEDARAQLSKLGPPPEGGKLEARAVAAQRRRLTDRAASYVDLQKQVDLLQLELTQASTRLSAKERDTFFQRIFSADRSIINPGLWGDFIVGTGIFVSGVAGLIEQWWSRGSSGARASSIIVIMALLGSAIMGWRFLRRRLMHRVLDEDGSPAQVTSLSRLLRAFWGLFALVAAVVTFFVLLAVAAASINSLTPAFTALLNALATISLTVAFNTGLAWFICAPSRPESRLIAIDNAAARSLPVFVAIASLAASLNPALDQLAQYISVPRTFSAALSAIAAMALIASLAASLLVIRKQAKIGLGSSGTYFLNWFVNLMPVIWVLLGVASLGLLLGYLSFSYFITDNILSTALLLMVIALAHHLADALADAAIQPAHAIGHFFTQSLGWTENAISRLALVFRTSVDVLLAVIAIPALLATWTVSLVDFDMLYRGFSSGLTIGSITLSPWSILLGIVVLAIGVTLTRIITGWLNQRVLVQTSLDKGVQDSVRTAARYSGYIVAGALGLSVAGLDFSNIAIIAGALGVGIGFGLQSIVNNFVSGLILLAERPVRVGDWVVTNAGEGVVKKINVRSTEIETFDNCTVIVPNSNLITESVRNWTHRDTMGRFNIPVTIDPSTSNIDAIMELLKGLATSHPKVLRYPEAQVLLANVTPAGLVFELKGHVGDVFSSPRVTSDLRLEIVKQLAEMKVRLSSTTNFAKPVK